MSEAKHTPGPWTVTQTPITGRKNVFGHDRHIGSLEAASAKNFASFEADARLIAAAPDLLATAQRYLDACGHLPAFGNGSIPDIRRSGEVINSRDALEAAIAKATGAA